MILEIINKAILIIKKLIQIPYLDKGN